MPKVQNHILLPYRHRISHTVGVENTSSNTSMLKISVKNTLYLVALTNLPQNVYSPFLPPFRNLMDDFHRLSSFTKNTRKRKNFSTSSIDKSALDFFIKKIIILFDRLFNRDDFRDTCINDMESLRVYIKFPRSFSFLNAFPPLSPTEYYQFIIVPPYYNRSDS